MDFNRKLMIIFLTFFFFQRTVFVFRAQCWRNGLGALLKGSVIIKVLHLSSFAWAKSVFVCVSAAWCSAFVRYIFFRFFLCSVWKHCLRRLPAEWQRLPELHVVCTWTGDVIKPLLPVSGHQQGAFALAQCTSTFQVTIESRTSVSPLGPASCSTSFS